MNKQLIIILAVITNLYASGQNENRLVLDVGLAHRMNEIALTDKPFSSNRYGFNWSSIKHFRNQNIGVDVKTLIFKGRAIVQLSNYFRYGHVRYISDPNTGRDIGEINRVKHDHLLDIIFPFKNKSDKSIRFSLGAGVGQMNMGTSFTFQTSFGRDSRGNPIIETLRGNFSFLAPRIILGVSKQNLHASIIVYGTPDAEFDPNPTLWIEGKITYSVWKFLLHKKKYLQSQKTN